MRGWQNHDLGATVLRPCTLKPAGYGNLVSQRRTGATSFDHFDGLGSSDRLSDACSRRLASP